MAQESMAQMRKGTVTANSIYADINGLDGSYTGTRTFNWYYRLMPETDWTLSKTNTSTGSISTKSWTYSNLLPDSLYDIHVEVIGSIDAGSYFIKNILTKKSSSSGGSSGGSGGGSSGSYDDYTFQIKDIGFDTLTIVVKGLSRNDEVFIMIEPYDDLFGGNTDSDTIEATSSGEVSLTFTNLLPNTKYAFWVWVNGDNCYYEDDDGIAYPTITEWTTSFPYFFTLTDNKDSTVTVHVHETSSMDIIQVKVDGIIFETKTSTGSSPYTINVSATFTPNVNHKIDVSVNGAWIGEQTFKLVIPRPKNWSWTPTITSNSIIQLTAEDWNNFTNRINEFRKYKGLSEYTFIKVNGLTSNTPSFISAPFINPARTKISEIDGYDANSLPPIIKPGDQITESIFNGLKDALNAIP